MQLYYIRHAQSLNNARWEQTGSNTGRRMDPELTETGRRQAEILAQFLKQESPDSSASGEDFQNRSGFHLTHVYTSLMERAVCTGTTIAEVLGLPLVAWVDLHESGGLFQETGETGELVGMPGPNRTYFEGHHPNLVYPPALGEAGWWNKPFEEYEERPVRARRVLEELITHHGGSEDRVAFVSHGGFYNYFLMAILGLSSKDEFWFLMHNTAISRFDFVDGRVIVVYQNKVDFLPQEMIK